MKVLVTGSKGFIGRHVLSELEGHEVVGFNMRDGEDVRNYDKLKECAKGCDVIIHLSALCEGRRDSVKRPGEYLSINVGGTINVLRAAVHNKVRKVIFLSTPHAFDPKDPYGLSKSQAENWARLFRRLHGLNVFVLRSYHVYGEGERRGVVKVLIENIKNDGRVTVYGDGNQSFDFIHVDDLARIIKMFVDADHPERDYFEICTGKATSINDLIGMISEATGVKPNVEHMPARTEDVSCLPKVPFGHTKISLKDGIRRLVEYYSS